jgi:hypothetical protein
MLLDTEKFAGNSHELKKNELLAVDSSGLRRG